MPSVPDELAGAAQAALAVGDWHEARRAFEAWVGEEPTAEALAGLGDVLWWLGETDDAVRYQTQAYVAFRRRHDAANSTMMAVGLYLLYRASLGNAAAAHGWLARAARLASESGLPPLEGWVALLRAHDSSDPVQAAELATHALEVGNQVEDPDLELCALSQQGVALVAQGRGEEGLALLDEAMAAALAGEAFRPHTVVYTSCNVISACAENAELEHALQWIRAADGFEQRFGNPHLYTTCRCHQGAILFASGDWPGAERELSAALAIGSSGERGVCAEAAARFAELRLAQGRLEEVERVLDGFEDFQTSSTVLAQLAAARGDESVAHRLAHRRIVALTAGTTEQQSSYRPGLGPCLEQGALLELLTQVGPGEDAEAAVQSLTDLASRTGCEQLTARARRAAGRVRSDQPLLEDALDRFNQLHLPLEAGRTRLALAEVSDADAAAAEAQAALAIFESLGAARDADAAAARLRELGVAVNRGGPVSIERLTRREQEVLELLGEGLSNREIAERLFLSLKTVERHVRNVLVKLGLRNRTEAAVYLVRRGRTRSANGGFPPMP
jgi:DNA-binding CsgD family transcriptional regulator